jgi:hypothetical protein
MKKIIPPPPPATVQKVSLFIFKATKSCVLGLLLSLVFLTSCKKNLVEDQIPDEPSQNGISAKDINWHIDSVYKMVVFKSFEDYHKYWDCYEKEVVHAAMKKAKFVSLYEALPQIIHRYSPQNNLIQNQIEEEKLPWIFNEDLSNFTQILNPNGLLTIDQYTIRVDDEGEHVFISEYSNLPNYVYRDDVGGTTPVVDAIIDEVNVQNHVFKYPTDYDIVDMLEEVGINNGYELHGFLCWKRGGAVGSNVTPAIYFLDETWQASVLTTQTNNSQGTNSNTRLGLRLQYMRLGVFFQLMLKGKYQYLYITGGGGRAWTSDVPESHGETEWNITFNEKHQGKCKNENEVFNNGTITPPLNNRNKTRRVFWERANGLHKYEIVARLNIYTKSAWRGQKTSKSTTVSPNNVFNSATPRLVSSLEIHPFTSFFIRDKY